ncbi:MAG: hypothetical protein KDA27_24550 [Candidatus Eisenbacteria bacterium]|uniref:Uncharacterized protein n=1 Tax=Eiseniibacteriota bacterium TaxID=2212470 RepID=A0A956NI40_UNCEI|nr:hypothetical protein [Candidatus Eisenbacteria bacterium]
MDRADGGLGVSGLDVIEHETPQHEIAPRRSGEEGRPRVTLAIGAAALALTVLLLRRPLWLLPGPGRDEASYHYWAHHPEPAFAPLVQLTVRLFELPFGHALWSLRAPVALLGIVVLWLHDDRLRRAGSTGSTRLFFASLLALTPWLGFSGSILHPDAFLLVSLLALVISARDRRPLAIAIAACAAALSKPTGVLVLPVAWWLVEALAVNSDGRLRRGGTHQRGGRQRGGRQRESRRRGAQQRGPGHDGACQFDTPRDRGTPPRPSHRTRIVLARTILILGVFPLATALGTGLLTAIGEFGHMSPEIPLASRFGTWGLALVFVGGLLLPWFGVRGGIDRARLLAHARRNGTSWTEAPETREAAAALATAVLLLAVFTSAALFRGQFKPNWVLPAFVLVLPLRPLRPPHRVGVGRKLAIAVGLAFSLGCSICQTLVLHDPDVVMNAEAALQRRGFGSTPLDYSVHAGTRERMFQRTRHGRPASPSTRTGPRSRRAFGDLGTEARRLAMSMPSPTAQRTPRHATAVDPVTVAQFVTSCRTTTVWRCSCSGTSGRAKSGSRSRETACSSERWMAVCRAPLPAGTPRTSCSCRCTRMRVKCGTGSNWWRPWTTCGIPRRGPG